MGHGKPKFDWIRKVLDDLEDRSMAPVDAPGRAAGASASATFSSVTSSSVPSPPLDPGSETEDPADSRTS